MMGYVCYRDIPSVFAYLSVYLSVCPIVVVLFSRFRNPAKASIQRMSTFDSRKSRSRVAV